MPDFAYRAVLHTFGAVTLGGDGLVPCKPHTMSRQKHGPGHAGGATGHRKLMHGDGCKRCAHCEDCPFPDCRCNDSELYPGSK